MATMAMAASAMAATALAATLGASPCAAWTPPRRAPSDAAPRACPEIGDGYVRLPGSGVCVRVSGFVRVEGAVRGGTR